MKERRASRSSVSRHGPAGAPGNGSSYIVQVHPVSRVRKEILAVTTHFLRAEASALGKPAPELSEDAAAFLSSRRWAIRELAARVARAVQANQGSLITAADLDT